MTFSEKISIIKSELQKPLPGEKQQFIMAPDVRRSFNFSSPVKKAAVMICIFPGDLDLQIVLMKRNEYDGSHSGQISFPGGVYEATDINLCETAIRETQEEIGMNCDKSSILGEITPLLIPVSNMLVHSFVGSFNSNPVFNIDKREVNFLITVSLSELLDPASLHKEKWILHGSDVLVPFYKVQGNIIWGATAMILCEFLAIIVNSGLYPQFQYSGNDRSDT
jgi:8-oxo-dGTP pyrophosphatase MutT (NUDIX family)